MHPVLFRLVDQPTRWLMDFRFVDRAMSFLDYQRKRTLRRRIEARLRKQGVYGDEVVRGPFKGIKFPVGKYASARFEKIIGTNEHELHPLIERLAATKHYDEIINVGAAEGFYAVGMAKLFTNARVICYEALADERDQCRVMVETNGVADRVEIRGRCSSGDLAAHRPAESAIVWMDIDTGEREVLDPVKVPWLKNVDICVENHDCLEPGLSQVIRKRFEGTHRIERFTLSGLDYDKYPELHSLNFEEIHAMVEHDRKGLHDWFFMEPLSRQA